MFDRNLMKLEGMPGILGALALLALLQAACILGWAFELSEALAALWEGAPLASQAPALAGFLACFALLNLLRLAQDTTLDRYSAKRVGDLRNRLLRAAFDGQAAPGGRVAPAAIATAATDGMDEIQAYVRIVPPKMIGMAAISLPVLVAVFALDWVSGVILAVMFPVIILFMVMLGKQARARAERQYVAYNALSNRFLDTVRGIGTISAFGAVREQAAEVYDYSERLRGATVRTLTTATLSSAVLDLCATFGVAAVAMMLAFRLLDSTLALAPALAALMLAPEFFAPIRSFAGDFHASLDGKNALASALDLAGDAGQGKDAKPREHGQERKRAACYGRNSMLRLEGVTARYGDGTEVGPFDLELHGFERVAVVGRSGSGKSTLANIVAGFAEPAAGRIVLDGQPLDATGPEWRRIVRYVPQAPYIFRASLADNIRFYRPDATLDEVRRAAEAVGLLEFAEALPEGLLTQVGEGARALSGGQAHRVALARMLLDPEARVLVFDEPTAHLDIETEYDLKQELLPLMNDHLVIFATHRMHWTRDLDRVVVLEDGRIASGEEVAR